MRHARSTAANELGQAGWNYDAEMSAPLRTGNDSRCCIESGAPYEWVRVEDQSHPQYAEYEAWLASMTPMSRAIEEGETDELFEAAAAGLLEDSGDNFSPIKPVTHKPEIYELRRRSEVSSLRTYIRFYHSEPDALPKCLVALHRHIKSDEDGQTDALAHSIQLHEMCERVSWGT